MKRKAKKRVKLVILPTQATNILISSTQPVILNKNFYNPKPRKLG